MTSAATAAITHVPFRTFSFPDGKQNLGPAAIGRNHASWFLVVPRPEGIPMVRIARCLNTIIPGDPTSVGALSSAGRHVFAVGGYYGDRIMDDFTRFRDHEGRAPVKVLEVYSERHPLGLCALVEVLIPDEELMYACARCGRWETQLGPRFLRCSGCKSRYYCSTKCQKDDWKPAYHRGECDLLRAGKHYEVENRRKLHNNGWWFHNGGLGDKALMAPTGEYEWERARNEGDWDYLAYGRRIPPHDVPSSASARPTFSKEFVASLSPDVPPPGFISTGSAKDDQQVIERFRATILGTDQPLPPFMDPLHTPGLASNSVPERDIPPLPGLPVPHTPGFVFMGDPRLDQHRLDVFLVKHGTQAEMEAFLRAVSAREACIDARRKLHEEKEERSRAYRKLVTDHLLAVRQNVRAIKRATGWGRDDGYGDEYEEEQDEEALEEEEAVEAAMAPMSAEGEKDVWEDVSDDGSISGEDEDEDDGGKLSWRSRVGAL